MPEIYRASNGSQYMIPGDNGKVISNKDLNSGSAGGGVVVNINNYTGATVDAQQHLMEKAAGLSMRLFTTWIMAA